MNRCVNVKGRAEDNDVFKDLSTSEPVFNPYIFSTNTYSSCRNLAVVPPHLIFLKISYRSLTITVCEAVYEEEQWTQSKWQ